VKKADDAFYKHSAEMTSEASMMMRLIPFKLNSQRARQECGTMIPRPFEIQNVCGIGAKDRRLI
jgi:hypothetical protein